MTIQQIIQFDSSPQKPINVLIVEDSATERMFFENHLRGMGHLTHCVKNGKEAINTLKASPNHYNMIFMDRMMPVMDGVSAVKIIKQTPELRDIPIIMVTSADTPEEMHDGLSAGVFYYLSKPLQSNTINAITSAVARQVNQRRMLDLQMRSHRSHFGQIRTCRFEFNTLEEAEAISGYMAQCFEAPDRVISGIAELMINAVEHGLYEIGYDTKKILLSCGTWRTEVERRQTLPQYANRKASAIVTQKDSATFVIITDNGKGFNWRRYLGPDAIQANDTHGRGIAQAKANSFDNIQYNDIGNRVIAYVGTPTVPEVANA